MYLKQLIDAKKTIFSVENLRRVWQVEDKNYFLLFCSKNDFILQ